MKLVIKREFNDYLEMSKYVEDKRLVDVDYRFAVVALTTDKAGKIVLQRRGAKARDDSGKLADIGGAYENDDFTFVNALEREIKEEVGEEAVIRINNFVGGILCTKYDPKSNKDVNWLFMAYECTYEGGNLLLNEPGKCDGYEFYDRDELPLDEMTETSRFFWNYYLNKYNKCYSYAMGIGEKINYLDKNKFQYEEDDGDYVVTFDKKYAYEWEEFIEHFLDNEYWNEYISEDKVVFMFKNTDGSFERKELTEDTNKYILDKCSIFADKKFTSLRKIIIENDFYSDKCDGVIFYD